MFIFFVMCLVLGPLQHVSVAQQLTQPPVWQGSQFDVDIEGNLFLLDNKTSTIKRLSKDLLLLGEIGGTGWENDHFDRPAGVWARNGIDVFIADYGNHRVQRLDRKLNLVSTFFTRESNNPDERFGYPTDVALSRLGDLYICDGENERIVKVDGLSRVQKTFGGFDAGHGRLQRPTKIEIGPHDYVYVLDGSKVMVFDSFGNFVHQIAEGVFKGDLVIHADAEGLAVISSNVLYCFDEEDRLKSTIPVDQFYERHEATIRSMAFSKGTLYLLTTEGLNRTTDPR
jgi:DNA-binding beta-propeller fold protein YncE